MKDLKRYSPPWAEVICFVADHRLCGYDDSWARGAVPDGSDNGIELPDDNWGGGNGGIELPDDNLN